MRILVLLCSVLLAACSSFNTYQAGNMQYEVFDRPAAVAQSLTIVGHCDTSDVGSNGVCRAGTLSEPQVYVQTGLLTSIFGPFITAAGIATAGKFVGDGLEKSGSQNNVNALNSNSNQTTVPGPWRGGYRH